MILHPDPVNHTGMPILQGWPGEIRAPHAD